MNQGQADRCAEKLPTSPFSRPCLDATNVVADVTATRELTYCSVTYDRPRKQLRDLPLAGEETNILKHLGKRVIGR